MRREAVEQIVSSRRSVSPRFRGGCGCRVAGWTAGCVACRFGAGGFGGLVCSGGVSVAGRREAKEAAAARLPDLHECAVGIGALEGFEDEACELVDVEACGGDFEDDGAEGAGLTVGDFLAAFVVASALFVAVSAAFLVGLELGGEVGWASCHGDLLWVGGQRLRRVPANSGVADSRGVLAAETVLRTARVFVGSPCVGPSAGASPGCPGRSCSDRCGPDLAADGGVAGAVPCG
jgi:hypothetical protein